MKKYSEIINVTYNGFKGREPLEWSNCWIDSANVESEKRILLIGDSTVRMIRSTLAKTINIPVDMIGTSSRLDDVLFVNLIDSFFFNSLYKYDIIFVQIGHHARRNTEGGAFSNEDLNKFESDYKGLIQFLKQYSNNIIIESIFESVVTNRGLQKFQKKMPIINEILRLIFYKEIYDTDINVVTNAKTEISKKIANSMSGGVFFADINDFMKRRKFYHIDHIHFENKAKIEIVNFMLKYIYL